MDSGLISILPFAAIAFLGAASVAIVVIVIAIVYDRARNKALDENWGAEQHYYHTMQCGTVEEKQIALLERQNHLIQQQTEQIRGARQAAGAMWWLSRH